MKYTMENPLSISAEKALTRLGASIDGNNIFHPSLRVEETETFAGAYRGYWIGCNRILINGTSFLDDPHYERFRLENVEE